MTCSRAAGLERGRVDLMLEPGERNVGLTVNEYETLLMQHDLVDVLRNPLHFAKIKGATACIDHPRQIAGKTLSYAKYDGVRVLNSLMEALRPRSVVARAAGREGDGAARAAVHPIPSSELPRGAGARRSRRARRPRHLSEPDPRAVAGCRTSEAPPCQLRSSSCQAAVDEHRTSFNRAAAAPRLAGAWPD